MGELSRRRGIQRVICGTNSIGPQTGCDRGRPTVVGMNQHAPTLILQGLHASFDPTGLMMRVCSRVCETLPFGGAVILPLATGKDAIVGVTVSHIHPIFLAELFEGSLGCTDIVTVLVRHQVNIAKIRTVINEHHSMLVSLPSKEASHLRNEACGCRDWYVNGHTVTRLRHRTGHMFGFCFCALRTLVRLST